ncbi:2',3'-cyclic-nucleotide 3'-phosphodiesterase-like [Glandiceps talaboti]
MGTDQIATIKIAVFTTGVACCLAYVVLKVVPNIMARYRHRKRTDDGIIDGDVTEIDGLEVKSSCLPPLMSAQQTPVEVEEEEKITDPTLDYPFLTDSKTIRFIQRSNIMFIMRGLPGSGKTHVAEMIRETYSDSIICSADDFRMVDGKYVFNPENLQKDHAKCQAFAKQCCEKKHNVVVIDNTNVRGWEMRYYLDLANQKNYTVVLVEPKTSWKFDAHELARRNKHNVQLTLLQKKVQSFETMIPLFFGWFLNYTDSAKVRKQGQDVYKSLQQIPEFVDRFKMCVHGDPSAALNFNAYFSADSFVVGTHMLHCTAKFCARGKVPDSYTYAKHEGVLQSLGKAFTTQIIGFFVTPRTLGVRLKLTPEQKKIWGQEDEKDFVQDTETSINRYISAAKGRRGKGSMHDISNHQTKAPVMSWEKRGGQQPQNTADDESLFHSFQKSKFVPTSGVGSRAHLTLGCRKGITAVQTGIDLVDIIDAEQEAMATKDRNVTLMLPIQGGTLRCYDNKTWMVYLDVPITVGSLYSGFY